MKLQNNITISGKRTHLNLNALRKLKAFIKTLPPKSCEMFWIMQQFSKHSRQAVISFIESKQTTEAAEVLHTCGAVGCMLGWAKVQYAMDIAESSQRQSFVYEGLNQSIPDSVIYNYFGLSQYEASQLFFSWADFISHPSRHYKTYMIDRLAGVIRDGKVNPWRDQYQPRKRGERKSKIATTKSNKGLTK